MAQIADNVHIKYAKVNVEFPKQALAGYQSLASSLCFLTEEEINRSQFI